MGNTIIRKNNIKNIKIRNILLLVSIAVLILVFNMNIAFASGLESTDKANDTSNYKDIEGENSQYDFSDIQKFIDENVSGKHIDFYGTIKNLISGKSDDIFKNMFLGIKESILFEVSYNNRALGKIILVAIIAALFTSFSKAFSNQQISETGFSVSYLVVITLLLSSFAVLQSIAYEVVNSLTEFMKAMLPVYMVSVGVTIGQVGAASFYKMALIILSVVEFLCLKVILPGINIYVVIELINNVSKENILSKAGELIKTVVSFLIKSSITLVLGINVVQAMLVPVSGSIRNNAAKSIVGVMTGSLSSAANITGLIYGTGSLIRNSIGAAGLIVLISIIIIPIIKIIVFVFTYQLTNAFIQPISDKRIVNSIQGVSNGAVLILRTVFMCILMFVITIAIVCVTN